jgi:putative restriction endonuclease
MGNAVFTTRMSPSYDDVPEQRYHFPSTYLRQVRAALNDWIIYYEPRRSGSASTSSGRQAYFAMAKVADIVPDTSRADHFYARIEEFQSFLSPVPFKDAGFYAESALRRDDGETNKGAFGRAVRELPFSEFDAIRRQGMEYVPAPYEYAAGRPPDYGHAGFGEDAAPYLVDRPLVDQTLSRPFRDVAFRRIVRNAYDNRCAISGLRLINGGGRPEVQAAHIVAVEDRGPDSVRNGLALSGTFHWLFDRGLISIDRDYSILKADKQIPEQLLPLFPSSGRIMLPSDERDWPHEAFLRHHRDHRFKG